MRAALAVTVAAVLFKPAAGVPRSPPALSSWDVFPTHPILERLSSSYL